MVTRVRIDAEGRTRDECEANINAAFQLLHQNSVSTQFTFVGSAFTSEPFGPMQIIPRESEFVEEVYESMISEIGAIHWRGRRVMRFVESERDENHWTALEVEPLKIEVLERIDSSIIVNGQTYVPVPGNDNVDDQPT